MNYTLTLKDEQGIDTVLVINEAVFDALGEGRIEALLKDGYRKEVKKKRMRRGARL